MTIFYLGYSLEENSGGIENYTYTILKYLQEQGHTICVYTLNGSCATFKNISIKKTKYLDRFFLGNKITKQLIAEKIKIDMYLCGHLFLAKYMEQVVKNNNYHMFVYGIDCWAGRFKDKSSKLKRLDKVLSISSFTTEQIRKQDFKGDIVYLPPVLDINKFPNINIEKDNQIIKFITVGRLSSQEQYKGHDKVIDAINILVKELNIVNIEYIIVGKGDDKKRLEEKVNLLKLNEFIKFYGFVSDKELPSIYAESDVFIMPSNVSLNPRKPEGEGFGIVFTEAAMYELALIGPNSGGSTDIIEDKINGLECDSLDSYDIASKMKLLIENPNLIVEYGIKAKEKTLENFTINQLPKYLNEIFDS